LVSAYVVVSLLAVLAAFELPLVPVGTIAFLGMAAGLGAGTGAVFALVARLVAKTDRKSTRLNSSHRTISYAVFCLKKKNSSRHNAYNILLATFLYIILRYELICSLNAILHFIVLLFLIHLF